MSAHDAEVMANGMLLDSPLLDPERANEEILEDGGSNKLLGEGEGEKLPERGDENNLRRPLQVSLQCLVERYPFICP